jgi:hypothetical protein
MMDLQLLSGVLVKADKISPDVLLKTATHIEATVINAQISHTGNTLIKLQIQDQILQWVSPQPLKLVPGQKLLLQLLSTTPVLTLKLLATGNPVKADSKKLQPGAPEIILKQWAGQKTPQPLSPVYLTLKDLPKLSLPVTFRFEVITATKKTVEGNVALLDKKTAPSFPDPAYLKLERTQIKTTEQHQLKTGQTLLLRFDPQKTDSVQVLPSKTASLTEQSIQLALRTFLPHQQPSPVVLESLVKHIDQITQQPSIPETLKNIARQILSDLPTPNRLTQAESLKQGLEQSGIFLESKFLSAAETDQPFLKKDFKAKLLNLLNLLQHQTSDKPKQLADSDLDLFRQIQQKASQVLARIVVDQLQSLPKEDSNKQVWLVEIPFLNQGKPDKVRLEIEQQNERDKKPQEADYWSVNITVSPPGLGTIYCKVVCINQVVSTHFWSESTSTTQKITRFLDILKQQLEDKGLTTGMMTAKQGKPAVNSPFPANQLLNEKA